MPEKSLRKMYDTQGISQYPFHMQTRKIMKKKGLIRGLEGKGHKEQWLEDDPHSCSSCLRDVSVLSGQSLLCFSPASRSERECFVPILQYILAVCVPVGSGLIHFPYCCCSQISGPRGVGSVTHGTIARFWTFCSPIDWNDRASSLGGRSELYSVAAAFLSSSCY